MSILTPKNGKYVPTSLTTLKDGEKTTNLAIFSEDYAKRIVNAVENGGGGGGGGTGDVTTEQLNEEIQARIDGDNTLTTNLNKEIQDRTNADTALQANIEAESSTRENADNALQSNIDNEAQARNEADNTLTTNLNKEIQDRTNADTTLQANIEAEKTARESADTTLQANIEAESSTRENADNALQGKIDSEIQTRSNEVQEINRKIESYKAVIKEVDTSSYPYLNGLKMIFNKGILIMQGIIYPLINSNESHRILPNKIFENILFNVNMKAILNSENETIESIIKSYEPNTNFNTLKANGYGENKDTTILNGTASGVAHSVGGYFNCGCSYEYDAPDILINFNVVYNMDKIYTYNNFEVKANELKYKFKCPFTIIFPLVTK